MNSRTKMLSLFILALFEVTQAQDPAAMMMPQILNIDAQCSLTGMTVSINFDRPYNGMIYSKGAFYTPGCVYVQANSGSGSYSFDVPMSACGTVADIEAPNSANPIKYFENTLVFQNDPQFQEIWDVARRVRCIWTTRFEESIVFTPFQVDMLNSELISFSGDDVTTAMAVQVGQGPFAPILQESLVQIGDTLTLAIFLQTEDDTFDIGVRDCYATDSQRRNTLQLTDERGCVLKPKILKPWQRTRDTRNTGAALIAYAFLNAFKFPDDMEVNVQCNIVICKGGCSQCGQIVEIREEIVTEPSLEITTTTTTRRPIVTSRRTVPPSISTTARTFRTFPPFRPRSTPERVVGTTPQPIVTPIAQIQVTRKKLGFHRRRRAVDDEISETLKKLGLSSRIMVVTPEEVNDSARHSRQTGATLADLVDNSKLCINTIVFAAGALVTLVLLLVTTMVATIFFLRQKQARKQSIMAGVYGRS